MYICWLYRYWHAIKFKHTKAPRIQFHLLSLRKLLKLRWATWINCNQNFECPNKVGWTSWQKIKGWTTIWKKKGCHEPYTIFETSIKPPLRNPNSNSSSDTYFILDGLLKWWDSPNSSKIRPIIWEFSLLGNLHLDSSQVAPLCRRRGEEQDAWALSPMAVGQRAMGGVWVDHH